VLGIAINSNVTTEFFADFGVYDVTLTLPQYEVVGATGVLVNTVNNADATQTLTYHGDDIHDFAWTASPRYKVEKILSQEPWARFNSVC